MAKHADSCERGRALCLERGLDLFSKDQSLLPMTDSLLVFYTWSFSSCPFSPTVQSEEEECKAERDRTASSQSSAQGQAGKGPRAGVKVMGGQP